MVLHALLRFARKILGMTILVIALSSCVPAALVVGATVGGAVVYDKRSMKTMVEDRDASQAAANLIAASPDLAQGTHISIAVFNHILLLVGQVQEESQKTTAYQIASGIKSISRVYNELAIQKPTSLWQRSRDSWITTKVKADMLAKKGLHSTQIKVVTENSSVYLMGVVTPQQAKLAADVARRTDGVREVVKVFENQQ